MARKLSSVARSTIWTSTALAVSLVTLRALAEGEVRISAPSTKVVNPFAAKRRAAAQAESMPVTPSPVTVPPEEVGVPKAYQNPFAKRPASPRFVTPQLHTGPLSRWHRPERSHSFPASDRPIGAVNNEPQRAGDKWDLKGPLTLEQERANVFELSATESNGPAQPPAPPDPSYYGIENLPQPTWLAPHETRPVASTDEITDANEPLRAVAQRAVDPFELTEAAEVFVSDNAPAPAAAAVPDVVEAPEVIDVPVKTETPQVALIPDVNDTPLIIAPRVRAPVAKPIAARAPAVPQVVRPLPPRKQKDADDWYADAEKSAGVAASPDEFAEVVHLCQNAIECRPDVKLAASIRGLAAWSCNRCGELESDEHREDEALKAFELSLEWDPNCWLALHNRAVSRAQQGDLAGALNDFNRSLQLNPGLAVAYRNRGELLAATGRTEEAVADYTNALTQLPNDGELHAMRGHALHRLGRYEEAITDLSRSIEIAPHNADVYANRGNVYAEVGEYQQAIADFRQALSLDAESADAHRSLAWLLATCPDARYRDPRQALAAAEQAAKLAAPGDPFVLDTLAAAHACAGEFDQAVRYQEEAISNVPGNFADPFTVRLNLYRARRPFRNGANVDSEVRAASLEAAPHSPR